MRVLRRFMRERRGAAIVEFALVVPIFFTLVYGIIQFSQAYTRLNCLNSTLREGARIRSTQQYPDSASSLTTVRNRMSAFSSAFGCNLNVAQINLPSYLTAPSNGQDVRAEANNYALFAGLNFFGLQNITVTRSVIFRWEYAP